MGIDRTEENSCDKSLSNESGFPKANTKYWVAARVQMNTEKKVSLQLGKLGYLNYVPTQTEIHQWSDRRKKIEKIVIPTIIFVLVDKEIESSLRKYSFIYRFISYPGKKEAAIIPEEQIQKLRFMLDNAESAVEFSDSAYEIGEEIEIVRGPLKGLCGELCYKDNDKPMVGVHVKLLGYSYVNIDIKDVKRRNNDRNYENI